MDKSKKTSFKKSKMFRGKVLFKVRNERLHKEFEVYNSTELKNYSISEGFSFVSKNDCYMSRLEAAERDFDRKFDNYISK